MDENYDFSGWASKYEVPCSDGRTIKQNALAEDDGKTVPLVWNHQHGEMKNVVGHALLKNRPEGVYCFGYVNDTEDGKRAKELLRHKDITALSIFANNLKQNKRVDGRKDVVHGKIREVSLVLAGANPGACIDSVMVHSDDGEPMESDDEAQIYNDDNTVWFGHSDESEKFMAEMLNNEDESQFTDTLEHADGNSSDNSNNKPAEDETVEDVLNTMTPHQREVMQGLINYLIAMGSNEESDTSEKGNSDMKHNIFDNTEENDETLEHSLGMDCDFETAISDMSRYGSLKKSFLAHGANIDNIVGDEFLAHLDNGTPGTNYGIGNIDYLFPDFQTVGGNTPKFVKRNTEWVARVMNAVSHTPFTRVKSVFANITEDEARARGYIKGKKKKEEVFPLLKRTTTPQTVYKKQRLDRDDILDVTTMDVVSWLRQEMRMMLEEEIARAIIIGDGRESGSDDKINEDHIRSILNDDPFYSIKVTKGYKTEPDNDTFAADFEERVVYGFEDYEGSGNPLMFTTQRNLNRLLMQKDKVGRRIYKSKTELCAALGVSDIVPVQVMKDLKRTPGTKETSLTGKTLIVDAVIVNPIDYNVGTDKGGAVSMFDDFDIDYNQEKYLIETRISGALTVPYSAMVVEHYIDSSLPASTDSVTKTDPSNADQKNTGR